MKTTVFLAHAEADHEFARELTGFLESGCDVICYTDEGRTPAGGDFIAKAEEGLAADVLVLLVSEASWETRYPRERWEPVLFEGAREGSVQVATVLLEECPFPELLKRRNFFDATSNRLAAMRPLKRWMWQRHRMPGLALSTAFSRTLEPLYSDLADQPGMLHVSGETAARFAREAEQDFEAVVWAPAHQRTLAQVAGEIGAQLGLRLEGRAEENCEHIREFLIDRRCLLVLDCPADDHIAELIPGGRTSCLITTDPVKTEPTPVSWHYARELIAGGRYAEAYDLLYNLLEEQVLPEACARELTWICEHWGRLDEAKLLRFNYAPEPSEQIALF